MLLDQISTLVTQLLAYYLPVEDISVKVTCSLAITTIVSVTLNFIYNKLSQYFKRKINIQENYIIIERNSKLYMDFIKHLYEKYFNETKGCKINDDDGMFSILIEELNNGELYDTYNNQKVIICFDSTNRSSNDNGEDKNEEKKKLSGKDLIVKANSMKILDEYIKNVIRNINTTKNKDINMYKLKISGNKKKDKHITWTKTKFVTNKTIQNTIVTDEVQKLYYDDLNKFINNKDYYFKKGIPYKRGYLLYGDPGCGKTSLIKAVAHDLNLPIFMVDLSVLNDNSELISVMNELNYHINANEPYLLILEDFDRTSIFGKGKDYYDEYNDQSNSKITQDCILNILDGIDESHGRIVVITTNDIDKVRKFKSLIRPGRIDIAIKVTYCTSEQLKRIVKFYFDINDQDTEKIACLEKLKTSIEITPAQLIQVIYLLNDIDKTILFLNKIVDFYGIDIEK